MEKKTVGINGMIGQSKRGIPISVLIVDDEFSHRRIMMQILKSIGFNVVGEGENGAEAVELYEQYNPQLVVMDMHMPRMTGLEALKKIMEFDEKAMVIMSTSEAEKDIVRELVQSGAKDYILKPVDRPTVIEKMNSFVEKYELR